jgi:hypothetical protein
MARTGGGGGAIVTTLRLYNDLRENGGEWFAAAVTDY